MKYRRVLGWVGLGRAWACLSFTKFSYTKRHLTAILKIVQFGSLVCEDLGKHSIPASFKTKRHLTYFFITYIDFPFVWKLDIHFVDWCMQTDASSHVLWKKITEQTVWLQINGDFNAVVSSLRLPQVLTFEEVMFCSLETLEFNCCSYDGFYFFIYKL